MSNNEVTKTIEANKHPFDEKFTSRCAYCGFVANYYLATTSGLKVGDVVPQDSNNLYIGQCRLCKRRKMVITQVPTSQDTVTYQGFWKLPEK
jgi:hypothetical protein